MRAGAGIRARIVGVSVVIVTIVVAVLGLIIWRAMTAALTATAHESLRGTVALIGNDLGTMSPTEAVPESTRPDGTRIQQVLDASGDVLAASSAAVASTPIAEPRQLPVVG